MSQANCSLPNIQVEETLPHVKDRGFTLLYPGVSPEADIFFIHGLEGHARATWTYPESLAKVYPSDLTQRKPSFRKKISAAFGQQRKAERNQSAEKVVYWPFDLLPKSFPNTRIFTYGYDSHVTNWFNGPSMQLDIYSYGESLLRGLEAHRREFPDRPLIFIVHSLGGLILKDALRRSRGSNEQRFRSIYLSTKSVFFLGTPHRGGSYINLGLTAQKLLVCSGFDANDKVLHDLKFDSGTAELLREEFSKILDETRLRIYTFQEAAGLSGFGPLSGKVVEDSSSSLDYALQEKDFIYANHVNMCRFSGFDDDGYEKITAALSHVLSTDCRSNIQSSTHGLYQKVLASLCSPDLQERFEQVEAAHEGTFEWLFTKDELGFVKWLQSGSGIYWISGKPASGKSTLLKYAVSQSQTYEHLSQNNPQNRWICGEFFFTNRGKERQKSIQGLLERVLYQLLSQIEGFLGFVERLFTQHAEMNGWKLIYLEDALKNIAKQRKLPINICLFIDALDEHNEGYHENHTRLVQFLQSLLENSDGKFVKIMLCLTSRPENVFQDEYKSNPGFRIHDHTHGDIQTYVRSRTSNYLRSRPDILADTQMIASLNHTFGEVIRRAEGVFLWVKLVVTDIIEGLVDGESPAQLQQNLNEIPGDGDLQELYGGILIRLKPKNLFDAFLMLQIAYAAIEPMPLKHFFQATEFTKVSALNYNWVVPTLSEMERQLIGRCRGFLEIQKSSITDELGTEYHGPIVQFLHQSVKDFLRDSTGFDDIRKKLKAKFPHLSSGLSENGYAYLLRFRISQHFRRFEFQPEQLKQLKFDLRKFEVLYHAFMVELTLGKPMTQPLDALSDFADGNGLVPFYLRHQSWAVPPSWQPTFLALAVQAGLVLYVRYVLESRVSIRMLRGRPLLHYAVFPMPESLTQRNTDPFLRYPAKMVGLLTQIGADIHGEFEGRTAFAFVYKQYTDRGRVAGSQLNMLEALLGAGSDTEAPIDWLSHRQLVREMAFQYSSTPSIDIPVTPLQLAVRKDDLQAANLLLSFGASIKVLTEEDWKFLRKGYLYGNEIPEFEPTNRLSVEEQRSAWLAERALAIKEGRNNKPMLSLVEKYQNEINRGRQLEATLSPLRGSSIGGGSSNRSDLSTRRCQSRGRSYSPSLMPTLSQMTIQPAFEERENSEREHRPYS